MHRRSAVPTIAMTHAAMTMVGKALDRSHCKGCALDRAFAHPTAKRRTKSREFAAGGNEPNRLFGTLTGKVAITLQYLKPVRESSR
jgi:hypothetical protein